jgi:hypothetical protein
MGIALAARHRINPLLVGLSIINGTNAGGFSPISVYYTIVAGGLEQAGVQVSPLPVFLATFLFNLALNAAAVTILGGWRPPAGVRDRPVHRGVRGRLQPFLDRRRAHSREQRGRAQDDGLPRPDGVGDVDDRGGPGSGWAVFVLVPSL